MCGITGIAGKSLNFNVSETVLSMAKEVSHRGPDGEGLWAEDEKDVAIAHRRLAIVDLTETGSQPMLSPCKRYVFSFNGEIYNFKELRSKLTGHRWRGGSDTEVLFVAILTWGLEKALKVAQGMFALCLFDRLENVLHLARDRYGEKPLFYSQKGGFLSFASELSAFKHLEWFDFEINNSSLAHYFEFGFTGQEASIYKSIFKLKPGSILTFVLATEELKFHCFFENSVLAQPLEVKETPSYKDAVVTAKSMLTKIIEKQMRVDTNFGAFLSGGIDSTLVVALMQQNSGTRVNTFSIGNEEHDYDESKGASRISAFLGTSHNELILTNKAISFEIQNITSYMDEPFADSSFIPTYLLSRFAKRKVKVCLTGDAGDEVFSGYNRYKWAWFKENIDSGFGAYLFKPLLNSSLLLSDKNLADIYKSVKTFLPPSLKINFPEDKFRKIRKVYSEDSARDIYAGLLSDKNARELILDFKPSGNFVFCNDTSVVKQLMLLDQTFYLPLDILKKVDKATMANGLESRIPYLDHNIVQFCQSLPIEYLMKDGQPKSILRDILSEFVPSDYVNKPKIGFGIPISMILRTTLRSYVEDLFAAARNRVNLPIDFEKLYLMWLSFLEGKSEYEDQIWRAVILFGWLEKQKESSK